MAQNIKMLRSKVHKEARGFGLDVRVEESDDGHLFLVSNTREGGKDIHFSAGSVDDFWTLFTAFMDGLRYSDRIQLVRAIEVRWVKSLEGIPHPSGKIVAWASCRVGPLYLNNIMLVHDENGQIEIHWPTMKNRDHYWWRPVIDEFESYLRDRIVEEIFGEGVNNNGMGPRR